MTRRRAQRTQAQRAVDDDIAGQQVLTAVDDAVRVRHAAKARKTEREILKGLAAASALGKPVAFPWVRTLRTFFPTMSDIPDLGKFRSKDVYRKEDVPRTLSFGASDNKGIAAISDYVAISGAPGHYGLRVTIADFLRDWVVENMMFIDGYRISFHVTVRDNGTALVTAQHNLISASRWLAIVHSSYVPGLEAT